MSLLNPTFGQRLYIQSHYGNNSEEVKRLKFERDNLWNMTKPLEGLILKHKENSIHNAIFLNNDTNVLEVMKKNEGKKIIIGGINDLKTELKKSFKVNKIPKESIITGFKEKQINMSNFNDIFGKSKGNLEFKHTDNVFRITKKN